MDSVLNGHIDDLLRLIPLLGIPPELRGGGKNSILEKCCRRSPTVMYFAANKIDDPRIMNMAINAYRDPEKENLEEEVQGRGQEDDRRTLLESMAGLLLNKGYVVEAYHLGIDLGMEDIVKSALGRIFEKVRVMHPQDMRRFYDVKEIADMHSFEGEYSADELYEGEYDREKYEDDRDEENEE
ncbi:MAG: hypothetical protein V1743_08125 [Nanoarchaeota archaeon]